MPDDVSQAERIELQEVFGALREMDAVLRARADRALGAVTVVWGVVAASIFVFYHLARQNPPLYEEAFGPLLGWMWLFPVAVGYAASLALGARAGRAMRRGGGGFSWASLLLPSLAGGAVAGLLLLTQRPEIVPGALLAFTGLLAFTPRASANAPGRLAWGWRAFGALQLAFGAALLLLRPGWAWLAVGLTWGAGHVVLGTLRYRGFR